MTTSATGKRGPRREGFTLVELLAVVAIMAIVMGVLGLSLRNMQGPSTQVAAAQVASGLSLARQLAISRNAETRFVIFGGSTGDAAQGVPEESWRYWTIITTNKNNPAPANNIWIMEKDWEKLPEGVVFLNIATAAYSTINVDPIGATIGRAFRPLLSTNIGKDSEWTGFSSFGNFNVAVAASPDIAAFALTSAPVIGYKPSGEAVECKGTPRGTGFAANTGQAAAVRVAEGSSTGAGEIILRSTNNYYYVETDKFGRVRVRARESYR